MSMAVVVTFTPPEGPDDALSGGAQRACEVMGWENAVLGSDALFVPGGNGSYNARVEYRELVREDG